MIYSSCFLTIQSVVLLKTEGILSSSFQFADKIKVIKHKETAFIAGFVFLKLIHGAMVVYAILNMLHALVAL